MATDAATTTAPSTVHIPRIAIKFCTQCKWNLRAAYYAQELLQTFGTSLGEVALVPASGGIFTITLTHSPTTSGPSTTTTATTATTAGDNDEASVSVSSLVNEVLSSRSATVRTATVQETLLWDRKVDGGFPETKELKNRVRNVIEPGRDLGHIDRVLRGGKGKGGSAVGATDGETSAPVPPGTGRKEREGMETPGEAAGENGVAGLPDRGKEECLDCK